MPFTQLPLMSVGVCVCVCVCVCERERETERQRDRETERDRERMLSIKKKILATFNNKSCKKSGSNDKCEWLQRVRTL